MLRHKLFMPENAQNAQIIINCHFVEQFLNYIHQNDEVLG